MEEVGKHLWEYEHPHYASSENYFKKGVGKTWPSWAAFMEETGRELEAFCGLVFRWDWELGDVQDVLHLFCVNQRKGIYVPLRVMVEKADEPEVLRWLQPRAEDLAQLWSPVAGSLRPNRALNWKPGEIAQRDPLEQVGQCEFCGADDAVVRPYENRRQPEALEKPKKWLCCLCSCTHASVAYDYGSEFDEVLKTLCFTANCTLAEGEEPDAGEISTFRRYVERLHRALIVDKIHAL